MQRTILFFAIMFVLLNNNLSAQNDNRIFLETQELKINQRLTTVVSPDGKYIISSKFLAASGAKNIINNYPDFKNKQKPTTLIIDIKSGKLKTVIENFVVKSVIPNQDKILGFNENGISVYNIKTNEIREISGIPDDAKNIISNGKYIIYAMFEKLKVTLHIGELIDDRFIKKWEFESIGLFTMTITPDGKNLLFAKTSLAPKTSKITVYNLENGESIKSYQTEEKGLFDAQFTDNGKKIIHTAGTDIYIKDASSQKVLGHIKNKVNGLLKATAFSFNGDASIIVTASPLDGKIKIWDANKASLIKEFTETNRAGLKNPVLSLSPLGNDDLFLITYKNGVTSILSIKRREIIGKFYFDFEDWAIVAKDGRMDGTEGAISQIFWHNYKTKEKISIATTFDQFFTPKLIPQLLYGKKVSKGKINIGDMIKYSPSVSIIQPDSIISTSEKTIALKIKAQPSNNEPIKEIIVFINGKAMPSDIDGFNKADDYKTKTISLLPGKNVIKVVAVTEKGFQSSPDQIIVTYKAVKTYSNLYILVIGIDNYKNPKYKLNYAVADAAAFKTEMENGSQSIFTKTETVYLSDEKASKQGIVEAFNVLKQKVESNDVFIFYYAGHGVMSEEENSEFYIIPYDVTQLYGNNGMLRSKGISAKELQEFSKEIKAQKQLFVFDACQSGGMVEHLAMRGAAEEKAIAQLARSTGTYWLAASGSKQFATEFSQLGHGLFTYAILQALKGKADGGSKDKKITVKEISAYLNDMVPELSQKYKGSAQYPNSYGYGQDFPVVIVK